MTTLRGLLKQSAIYTTSNVIRKSIPFFILPILTRYLTPKDYGIVALYEIFASIGVIVLGFRSWEIFNVRYFSENRQSFNRYVGNVVLLVLATSALAFVGLWICQYRMSEILQITGVWVPLVGAVACFRILMLVNLTIWRLEQKPLQYGLFLISLSLLNFFLSLYFVVSCNLTWPGRLLGIIVSNAVFGVLSLFFVYWRGDVDLHLHWGVLKESLKFGLPLVPNELSTWFRMSLDRILITALIGATATGIYTIAIQISMPVLLLAQSANEALVPYTMKLLAEKKSSGRMSLVKLTYGWFSFLLLITLSLVLLGPWVISLMTTTAYAEAVSLLGYVAFAQVFRGMRLVLINYIFHAEETRYLAYITFCTSMLHLGLSFPLIRSFGAIGAAYASLISVIVEFVSTWILSAKVCNMPWAWKVSGWLGNRV